MHDGFVWGSHCYQAVGVERAAGVDWDTADHYCRETLNGSLLYIESQEEMARVSTRSYNILWRDKC